MGPRTRLTALLLTGIAVHAQSTPPFRSATKEVVLDVVVHDKHGHLVKDLQPSDVQVYEDGVRQTIKDFEFVQANTQIHAENPTQEPLSPPVNAPLKNSLREAKFISIVLGQMATADRGFGRDAVLALLKNGLPADTYVTMYRLDLHLQVVQPYTNQNNLLVEAANRAAKGLYMGTAADAATTELGLHDAVGGDGENAFGKASFRSTVQDPLLARNASGQDASFGLTAGAATQANLISRLRFVDSVATGMSTMDALRELIRSQATLPGRKVVLYLADGLNLPAGRPEIFRNLISFANRANVTFYAVDTRGLSTTSPMSDSLTQLSRAVTEGSSPDHSISHHTDDDVELMGVSNTQLAMRELAESTGGFAVANTNVVTGPMQRLMQDIQTYYELTYSPTSDNYDGQFRRIEVKVEHATVEARKGYFAVPDVNGEPLQPFEMAALKALSVRPLPNAFSYSAEMMHFKPTGGQVECEMAFDVPVSSLQVVQDRKAGKARVHASVVALIYDRNGNLLDKVSRDLYREAPAADLPGLQSERILYAEPLDLKTGYYKVDTAVTDEQSQKIAARRLAIFVPASDLSLSSLEIVKRVDPLQTQRNPRDPFELANERVTPSLADKVSSGKPLNLYFIVYPASDNPAKPQVIVQLFRDGKQIVQSRPDLPKANAAGSIPMSIQLSPSPGDYDIRVTVQQGSLAAQSDRSVIAE